MAKQKTSVTLLVADGAGGMRPLDDLRFSDGDWPARLRVPAKHADKWMAYLDAECEMRSYSNSSSSQLEVGENSGTMQVRLSSGASAPTFDIVWERERDKHLKIRARPSGEPRPSDADVRGFLAAVTRALRSKRLKRSHRRTYLTYRGVPWCGELWLTPELCLGPPTKQPEYQNDPHIIIVDALVEGIGSKGVNDEFRRVVRELVIFLDVVVGTHTQEQKDERVWIYSADAQGHYTDTAFRTSAYYELDPTPQMPVPGRCPPVPIKKVQRIGTISISSPRDQQSVPEDTAALWNQLQSLHPALHRQVLEAGNAFTIAQSLWPDQRTAFASFLVVACEALKPTSRKYRRANIYDVIASFQGPAAAEALRKLEPHPQDLRSEHFHRGKVVAEELAPRFGTDYFADPGFDDLLRALWEACHVCLTEWLRRAGAYKFQWMPRPKPTWMQRLRRAFDGVLRALRKRGLIR